MRIVVRKRNGAFVHLTLLLAACALLLAAGHVLVTQRGMQAQPLGPSPLEVAKEFNQGGRDVEGQATLRADSVGAGSQAARDGSQAARDGSQAAGGGASSGEAAGGAESAGQAAGSTEAGDSSQAEGGKSEGSSEGSSKAAAGSAESAEGQEEPRIWGAMRSDDWGAALNQLKAAGADEDEDEDEVPQQGAALEEPPEELAAEAGDVDGGGGIRAAATSGSGSGAVERTASEPADNGKGGKVSCILALNIPTVALLFLTKGPMAHHSMWTLWQNQMSGLIPASALADPNAVCLETCDAGGSCRRECGAAAVCHAVCRRELAAHYGSAEQSQMGLLVHMRQRLFKFYTHAPPEFPGYPKGSLLDGTLIPDRISTQWGSHSLMVAERRLVQAALADPATAWVVLLSETTIPLYPPTVMWLQLMAERKSKINACRGQVADFQHEARMSRFMETRRFKPHHWRKSSQWWMLNRRHAEMVVEDEEVRRSFSRHCKVGQDRMARGWRDCISDEHLVPSLLAMLGEERNTTCDYNGATFVDWTGGGAHPRSFGARAVMGDGGAGIIKMMRRTKEGCGGKAEWAIKAARQSFLQVEDLAGEEGKCRQAMDPLQGPEWKDPYPESQLPEQCDLLARKFLRGSAPFLLRVFRDCSSGLGVLPCNPRMGTRGRLQQPGGRRLQGQAL